MRSVENLKKIFLLMTVLGLLYAGIASVLGVQGVTSITPGASSRAIFNQTSSQSIDVQAGNVTELNISGIAVTTHWAGFYGKISGSLTLQNANGDVFYNWSGLNALAGEVFASTDNAVSWSTLSCADSAAIAALETALGISATDADRVERTYTSNAHPDFEVGGVSLSGCNSTNAYVSSSLDPGAFYQVLLADGEGDIVYTTLINESTTGFNGLPYDFQLLVGESDAPGVTALYFYIELD